MCNSANKISYGRLKHNCIAGKCLLIQLDVCWNCYTISLIVGEAYDYYLVDFIYKSTIYSASSYCLVVLSTRFCAFVFYKTNAQGSCNSYAKSERVLVDFFFGIDITTKCNGISTTQNLSLTALLFCRIWFWKGFSSGRT